MKNILNLLLQGALFLPSSLLALIQSGDVVLVDFGMTLPTTGNYNVINSGSLSVTNLVRSSDGAGVGAGLSVTATNPFDNVNNVASTAGIANLNSADAAVYEDGFLSANGNNGSGNDTVTLTFSGLDDSLSYELVGGLSRSSGASNFATNWVIAGATTQSSDGTTANGHVLFTGLSSTAGNLVITLTDTTRQSGLAQLALTATPSVVTPPPTGPALPCVLDLSVDAAGDVILTLDQAAGNFVVQQSDTLTNFINVESTVEASNNQQLRVSAADILDLNGNGKAFFRLSRKPNFIVILTDDQGYQDLGCYGSPTVLSPRIDQMAAEGIRFTDFYAQVVCGPSRDALLTGCYPLRTAHHPTIISGDNDRESPHPRLELSEITVAELLKTEGYATEAYGKWDVDGRFQFSSPSTHGPTGQGFDAYYATTAGVSTTTQVDTNNVISFIQNNSTQPFFAYVAYNMPHVVLAATPPFIGSTGNGIYADIMAEIDHSVGRILDTLAAEGLEGLTYVMFMSDNGPWYLGNSSTHINQYGSSANAEAQGGSALPLRGDKTTSWEGGFRVPSIMWAPGRIPAGQVSAEMATTMDVMPTIVKLAGGQVPTDRVIDGHDIAPIIHNHTGATSQTDTFFYYVRETLHAVRKGKWKLHAPHTADTFWQRFYRTGDYFTITSPLLYDLDADIGETTDVSAANPAVVTDLMNEINAARADIGDYNVIGANAR